MSLNRAVNTNVDGSHELIETDDDNNVVRQQHVALNEDLDAALAAFWPPNLDDAKAGKITLLADYVAAVVANEGGLTDQINACTTFPELAAVSLAAGWPDLPA